MFRRRRRQPPPPPPSPPPFKSPTGSSIRTKEIDAINPTNNSSRRRRSIEFQERPEIVPVDYHNSSPDAEHVQRGNVKQK
jgi:hypothetical protein